MIISHKHKFIFVKTHKTATQSFFNVIKPYLGPDDVSVGDERVADDTYNLGRPTEEWRFVDTSLNLDQQFPTGKTARDVKAYMGNHIPWFTIKDTVGDDIWNTYTKFSIERAPRDRIISLFYFLEKRFVNPLGGVRVNPESEWLHGTDFTINEKHEHVAGVGAGNPKNPREPKFYVMKDKELSPVDIDPEGTRRYFEDWLLCQLLADELPLNDQVTYGVEAVPLETQAYRNCCESHELHTMFMEQQDRIKLEVNNRHWMTCPSLKQDILISDRDFHNDKTKNAYQRYLSLEGQCRFLNYGYYHDGDNMQVDHLIKFDESIVENYNDFFKRFNIDINLTPEEFNGKSLNTNHRKNITTRVSKDWWFEGDRGDQIKEKINDKFGFVDELYHE